MRKNNLFMYLTGAVTGFANGLFGSGGGVISVPALKKAGYESKKAHACSLAVTLPLSIVSVCFYISKHDIDIKSAFFLIPWGIAGAVIGTGLLKKIPTQLLSKLFGVLLVIAGWRMIAA